MKLKYKVRDTRSIVGILVILLSLTLDGIWKYPLVIATSILFFFLTHSRRRINKKKWILVGPAFAFLTIGLVIALLGGRLNVNSFKTVILYTLPVVCAICIESVYVANDRKVMNGVFLSLMIMMIVSGFQSFRKTGRYESSYAYIFSFFLLYYLENRKYSMVALCGLFVFLGDKRAAILSTAVAVIVFYICSRKKENKVEKWCRISFFSISIFIFVWIFLIRNGVMYSLYKYGISPMGRDAIYSRFNNYYTVSPLFLGKGAGFVFDILYELKIPGQDAMHCDWLHIYIETGFWGLVVYLYMFYRIIQKTNIKIRPVVTALFSNMFLIMMFGNLAITIYQQFVVYYILLYYFEKERVFSSEKNSGSNLKKGTKWKFRKKRLSCF